jgi:hypothetical protein
MGDTFDSAWAALMPGETAPHRRKWAREALALRIIEVVKGGERDVTRLRQDALSYLSLPRRDSRTFIAFWCTEAAPTAYGSRGRIASGCLVECVEHPHIK